MAPRGGARGRKPVRGGGKHFSRDLGRQDAGADGFDGVVVPEGELNGNDAWRSRRASVSSDESGDDSGSESDSSQRSTSPPPPPPIAVANPNRAPAKNAALDSESAPAPQLSRREREAMQAAAAKERYWKLHAEGKTDQARADLARLALIRKEREEKARQRKAEQEAKESEQAAKAISQGRRK